MAYVADLHTHSKYAGACSRELNIPNLAKWANYKGIDLLGTGDCLHTLWQAELKRDLIEHSNGTYEPKEVEGDKKPRFIVSTEVACIYSEDGKGHRIHLLIYFPSLDAALKLAEVMTKKGAKLASDGRPMLGMSAKQICEMVFAVDKKCLIIPAHIWTPWYSLYGSNSGYDFFKQCFGEFSDQIYAVETGLSSEPAMNWRVADLDDKSIVSFSDLHSLPRMAREATLFRGQPTYEDLTNDLKNQNIFGTIEFFPEEGKYHYSGHRNCGVVYNPEELSQKGDICPVCKRKLTVGVMTRVEELSTRSENDLKKVYKDGAIFSETFPKRPGFRMLIQLEEIIAEVLGVSPKSQKVQNEYQKMVLNIDTELKILTKTPIDLISMAAGEKIAEGVERVRRGKLTIEPGYDNTYGIVKIWS